MKKVLRVVRTFLIKDDKVLAIKYIKGPNKEYYDIPGGKIEKDESSYDTSLREFKEETGIKIVNQKLIGKLFIEYPTLLFDIDVYKVESFSGKIKNNNKNNSMMLNIDKLLSMKKIIPDVDILNDITKENFKIHLMVSDNHQIINKEIF